MSTVIKSLDIISNKGFCTRTVHIARAELEKIKENITEEEYNQIRYLLAEVDADNPDVYLPEYYRKIPYAKSDIFYSRGKLADYIKDLKDKYKE